MPLPPIVEERLPAIRALCRDLGIAQLRVFGSVARGEWNPQHSAVDFLVELSVDCYPAEQLLGRDPSTGSG